MVSGLLKSGARFTDYLARRVIAQRSRAGARVQRRPASTMRSEPPQASGSRLFRSGFVCPTASEVLFHLGDRLRYGVSIMPPRGLQISTLDQFGDELFRG